MRIDPDVRWKQRLQSFDRGLSLLRKALAGGVGTLNELEKEGCIQRFQYSLELAWTGALTQKAAYSQALFRVE